MKTELYRAFNKKGELLYIGISLSTFSRLASHKIYSVWFEEASRVEIEHFETREDALNAEAFAIKNEEPKYNIQHKKTEKEVEEEIRALRALEAKDRIIRKTLFNPIYTTKELGEFLFPNAGAGSTKKINDLIDSRQIGAFVTGTRKVRDRFSGETRLKNNYAITGWSVIDYLEALYKEETQHKEDLNE